MRCATRTCRTCLTSTVPWARQMQEVDPSYFGKLSQLQTPSYLWIGCSDSRVPANQIVGLLPGEVLSIAMSPIRWFYRSQLPVGDPVRC